MASYKKNTKISEKDYARYLKNAEEMERLILEARISYDQIERIRKQPLGEIKRYRRIRFPKIRFKNHF